MSDSRKSDEDDLADLPDVPDVPDVPDQVSEESDTDDVAHLKDLPNVPDQIDFQVVASWLRDCQQEHGPKCGSRRYAKTGTSGSGHTYLLDVSRGSVGPASLDNKFIALSYVWGGIDQLRLLKSNRDALAEPGALQSEIFRPQIGQTLRDAMAVVRALGERYLWIDALCICQDDPEHKREQIGQMAAIYDAAELTIVACTAVSSESSLPGVEPGSRLSLAIPITDSDDKLMAASAAGLGFIWNFSRSPHHGRAWTFQEVVVSRRCLFFFGNQVLLQCQVARRTEGSNDNGENNMMNMAGNWPPLDPNFPPPQFRYHEFVLDYTRRKLTFPTDRLDAFSALTTAMEKVYGWPFRYALPLHNFSLFLLWVPTDPVAMRTDGRETLPLSVEYLFPSWSWLSHPGSSHYYVLDYMGGIQSYIDWGQTACFWDGQRSDWLTPADDDEVLQHRVLPLSLIDRRLDGFPPGTLVAMAITASLETLGQAQPSPDFDKFEERRKSSSASGSIHTPLIDTEGHWYGMLLGISEVQVRDILQQEGTKLALIILSTSEFTWVMGGWSKRIPCFDSSQYTNESWCTVNVMLVMAGERPHMYRRLAIGEMHVDAQDKLSTKTDLICLA